MERLNEWVDINPGIPILLAGVGDNLGSELAIDDEHIHRFLEEFDIFPSQPQMATWEVFQGIPSLVLRPPL